MQFTSVQIGLDIATSMAIMASAITFLINQKRKANQAKKQQLDNSVRTVATEQLQKALHTLSRKFINEVVNSLNMPSNALKGDNDRLERTFARRKDLPARLLEQFTIANQALSSFVDEVHAHKYQIYPLLDTLIDGEKEIAEFKRQLEELINIYNKLNRSATPLAVELEEVLEFCANNSYESLDEEKTKELLQFTYSIMHDQDYAYWVNSFIADEDEAEYWEDQGARTQEVRLNATRNFISHAYESPERLRRQVFSRVFMQYQDGRIMCKKFLIMLAAINHTLLCRNDIGVAKETPSQTAERYAQENYFSLHTEVR